MTTEPRARVVCKAFTTDWLRDLDAAEHLLVEIEELGACSEEHTIEIEEEQG